MSKPWRLPHELAPADTPAAVRPRSIVFLGSAHDNGGSSMLATSLAEKMRAQGHRVEEWYLFGNASDLPTGARLFAAGPRSRSPLVLIRLFAQVTHALRERKADAVFGLQSLSNLMAATAGRLAGVPNRIATLHNPRERQNRILMAFDRLVGACGLYSRIVACGHTVAESFVANGPAYSRHLCVIPNGYARPSLVPREEARRELGLPQNGAVLGQIGRLSEQKNQSFSLALLKDLPDATLLILGSGPDEAKLKREIDASGLSARVRMVSSITHERIGLFYSAADLMLFPSRFEGLSLAAIEAIHSGVPLLCADIPSFREMFASAPRLAGRLLLPLDRTVWLARINDMLSDPVQRSQTATELARLSPVFDFATMTQHYLRLLD